MIAFIFLYYLMLVFSTKIPHPGSQMHPAYQFMLVVMNIRVDFMAKGSEPENKNVPRPYNVGEF